MQTGSHATRLSSEQLVRRISMLEREGYKQASCTVGGTRLVNPRTRESVTVKW